MEEKVNQGIFKVDLKTASTHPLNNGSLIPYPVRHLIEYLGREDIMNTIGLYRKAASIFKVKRVIEAFDDGVLPDLSSFGVHTASTVLKYYFSELPNSLCTCRNELYHQFIEAHKTYKKGREKGEGDKKVLKLTIRNIINQLPIENYEVLRFLIDHLGKVCSRDDRNYMTSKNLSIVFSSSVFSHRNTIHHANMMEFLRNTTALNEIFVVFLEESDFIFDPRFYKTRADRELSEKYFQERKDYLNEYIRENGKWIKVNVIGKTEVLLPFLFTIDFF